MLLVGASFLGDSGRRFGTRLLLAILVLGGSFFGRFCLGLLLATYVLNSLKRRKK